MKVFFPRKVIIFGYSVTGDSLSWDHGPTQRAGAWGSDDGRSLTVAAQFSSFAIRNLFAVLGDDLLLALAEDVVLLADLGEGCDGFVDVGELVTGG